MYNSILQFTKNDIYKIEASVRDLPDAYQDWVCSISSVHVLHLDGSDCWRD